MTLHLVTAQQLPVLYPASEPWLSKIPSLYDKFDRQSVYTEINRERWQLWVFAGNREVIGAMLSNITEYPLVKELHLLGIAGEGLLADGWKSFVSQFDLIDQYAKDNDCSRVVMQGARRGFSRMFKDYKRNCVILEKTL